MRRPATKPFALAVLLVPALHLGIFYGLFYAGATILMLPALAGLFGLPCHILLGIPAMYVAARFWGTRILVFALAGLVAGVASPLVIWAQISLILGEALSPGIAINLGWSFGCLFGAGWGAAVGVLYHALNRALPRRGDQ
ncbi:hypothetical protein [Oceaniglobus trochenteri]|uniref:hypothetical protein n=1 Tax=Oceaniglobus trochenteri TaxID=2763260 RepID=UPI001CFFE8B4|nr:hypothetical protein [Oceaniglobus trochenteri]